MFSLTKCSTVAGILALAVAGCLAASADTPVYAPSTQPTAPATQTAQSIATPAAFPADYKGTPYADEKYTAGPQKLPGTLMCVYYDLGGEGVAYHSLSKKNMGSNGLNKVNDKDRATMKPDTLYLHDFRVNDTVSTSYAKSFADKNPYDTITPEMDMLYVGWTDPGEWLNYTVDVADAGTYTVDFLYTSNKGGQLALDINGQPAVPAITVPSTNDNTDPTEWRRWHHWNLAKNIAEITLPKGKTLITLHMVENGNMNLGQLVFTPKGANK